MKNVVPSSRVVDHLLKRDGELGGGTHPLPGKIINWGHRGINDQLAFFLQHGLAVINRPQSVAGVSNKLAFFNLAQAATDGPRIPVFTNDLAQATAWLSDGITVMGRSTHGSCGKDIAFFNEAPDRFNASEFWVQYKLKKDEYRIHIMNGKVISQQKKALRKTDAEGNPIDKANVDFKIRNLRNGFIFQRLGLSIPADVVIQALKAMAISGLDFGAVDVIYNQHEDRAYVLEINTAPGLEGTTLEDYLTAFKENYGIAHTVKRVVKDAEAPAIGVTT
jgi:glutathione synthase/RimK-type ligase-like ATP-grasp enzyme